MVNSFETWNKGYKLYDAIRQEDYEKIENLIKNEFAGPNIILPEYGIAPIHVASGLPNEYFACKVLNLFLNHQGNPNLPSVELMTPVLVSVYWRRKQILTYLLNSGGDPFHKDEEGLDAFDYATIKRDRELTKILISSLKENKYMDLTDKISRGKSEASHHCHKSRYREEQVKESSIEMSTVQLDFHRSYSWNSIACSIGKVRKAVSKNLTVKKICLRKEKGMRRKWKSKISYGEKRRNERRSLKENIGNEFHSASVNGSNENYKRFAERGDSSSSQSSDSVQSTTNNTELRRENLLNESEKCDFKVALEKLLVGKLEKRISEENGDRKRRQRIRGDEESVCRDRLHHYKTLLNIKDLLCDRGRKKPGKSRCEDLEWENDEELKRVNRFCSSINQESLLSFSKEIPFHIRRDNKSSTKDCKSVFSRLNSYLRDLINDKRPI